MLQPEVCKSLLSSVRAAAAMYMSSRTKTVSYIKTQPSQHESCGAGLLVSLISDVECPAWQVMINTEDWIGLYLQYVFQADSSEGEKKLMQGTSHIVV